MKRTDGFLTDAQLRAEVDRCLYCEEKPCREACPVNCSPADFIMAARVGAKADFRRSAAIILGSNPLGGVCGAVCPDCFCMKACSRRTFDRPIEIPAVQAAIVERAKSFGVATFSNAPLDKKKIAVIGAGPAGLGAAGVLAQRGYQVTIFEQRRKAGGMMNLIPDFRLNKEISKTDIDFIRKLGAIEFKLGVAVAEPESLLQKFAAVIVCAGLTEPIKLNIPGEELALSWQAFLENQKKLKLKGKKVAVLGGGAVAADCATTAKRLGAESVELVYRRRQQDMPLTQYERDLLLEHGVEITSCSKPLAIVHQGKRVTGLRVARMMLPPSKLSRPENFVVSKKESPVFREFDLVISAIGSKPKLPVTKARGVFYAGDMVLGAATVVESVASGKNAAAEADAFIRGKARSNFKNRAKSRVILAGVPLRPVPLDADFFGRKVHSPFLLSAAPHSDGYEQMRKAYARGWSGGVMKTAFDNVPIHIPAGYMFALTRSTYGNCDNVSGHPLDRFKDKLADLSTHFTDKLDDLERGTPVAMCGMITGLQRKTNREGKYWAAMKIDDGRGTVDAMAFAGKYEDVLGALREDGAVFLRASVLTEEGGPPKLSIQEMVKLEEARVDLPSLISIRVWLKDETAVAKANALNELFVRKHGATEVRLRLEKPRDFSLVMDVTTKVRPDKEFRAELEKICGPESLEVLAR